jgi:hypothetical protein
MQIIVYFVCDRITRLRIISTGNPIADIERETWRENEAGERKKMTRGGWWREYDDESLMKKVEERRKHVSQ